MKQLIRDILLNSTFTCLGIVAGHQYAMIADKISKRRKTRRVVLELAKKSIAFRENKNVLALDHGKPTFKVEDLELKYCNKQLIIPVPAGFRGRLIENDPEFVFREAVSFDGSASYADISSLTKVYDLADRIARHSILVAEDFIQRQNNNRVVFNGQMFGVKKIFPKRPGEEEKNKLKIDLYTTDFFTYQVFASIYKELRIANHPISKVSKIEEFKNDEIDYSPFLCSFGLCVFILIHNQSEIILGERSQYITHQERKYHFSANEAFSQTDIDHNGKPSLYRCLYRGLYEELHIKNETVYGTEPKFLDLLFDREKFEIGITAVLNINDISFEQIRQDYKSAPDGSLETHDIIALKLEKKAIKAFLKNHETTAGAELGLQMLYTRYVNGEI